MQKKETSENLIHATTKKKRKGKKTKEPNSCKRVKAVLTVIYRSERVQMMKNDDDDDGDVIK